MTTGSAAPRAPPAPPSPDGLTSALLPPVVNEATTAILVVDLTAGQVTYANALAHEMVPGVELPISPDDVVVVAVRID